MTHDKTAVHWKNTIILYKFIPKAKATEEIILKIIYKNVSVIQSMFNIEKKAKSKIENRYIEI